MDYAQYEGDIPTIETPNQSAELTSDAKNSIGSEDIVVDEDQITEDDQFFIDYLIYNLGALPAQ